MSLPWAVGEKPFVTAGALRALAEYLETRPGSSEHIAALRNSVNWKLGTKAGAVAFPDVSMIGQETV